MTDTSSKILDVGQELIQTRGYNAISFQDIATRVGIKKPSVIHHFPSKAALGVAIIQRYRDTLASQLEAIKNDPDKTALLPSHVITHVKYMLNSSCRGHVEFPRPVTR